MVDLDQHQRGEISQASVDSALQTYVKHQHRGLSANSRLSAVQQALNGT